MVETKVGVIGLGVGYALSCALAEAGFDTIGLDINPEVVKNPRRDPSVEKLLSDKETRIRIEKKLKLTASYSAMADRNYIILCVSTGDEKKLVLGHVVDAVQQCINALRPQISTAEVMPLLMVYSTLPFGSSKRIREILKENKIMINEDIGYVHFPLMIAQGTTAPDFVNPPFVIFGSDSVAVAERAMAFYRLFIKRSCLYKGQDPPMFTGTPEEAELSKLCANACLTTKIAISNEIGSLCERLGVDGQKVMEVVGSDWRIGRKFTIPGFAVGGACFPRDLKSLIDTFEENDVTPQILSAVDRANQERLSDPLDKIKGKRVLVLGKSYKPGLAETKGSPSMALTELLTDMNYQVETYDPKFDPALPTNTTPDTIIITLAEPAFKTLVPTISKNAQAILDYANIVEPSNIPDSIQLWQAGKGWRRKGDNCP